MKTLIAVGAALATLLLSTATAHADCQTDCYDSGNTGYHCVTSCTDY